MLTRRFWIALALAGMLAGCGSNNHSVAPEVTIVDVPRIPDSSIEHRPLIKDMAVGQVGCVFVYYDVSVERHIWLDPKGSYTLETDCGKGLVRIERRSDGFVADGYGLVVGTGTDADFLKWGKILAAYRTSPEKPSP